MAIRSQLIQELLAGKAPRMCLLRMACWMN